VIKVQHPKLFSRIAAFSMCAVDAHHNHGRYHMFCNKTGNRFAKLKFLFALECSALVKSILTVKHV
jgi:hypothetical protein